ncbi:MAG: 2-iminobutanoate/2-iminopropanoate deaminase [Roseivirga sp.]|jgi:2-iminobutanoate/2-iminopropanoate deaminase
MKNILIIALAMTALISCNPSSPLSKEAKSLEHYQSPAMSDLGLPFSDAVIVDDIIYLSGQVGNMPGTLELAPGGLAAEAKQAIENMKTLLEANGSSLEDVIKVTVMMADISEWAEFNQEYTKFFNGEKKPARSAFGTNGLALDARLEIECIALRTR